MHPLDTIPGHAGGSRALRTAGRPAPVSNTLTVAVAAGPERTVRALQDLDLYAPAIRALGALGLTDRVTRTRGGLVWQTDGSAGRIDIQVGARIAPEAEDACSLTITTRFSATDEATHERLLDAWPVVGPLADTLVKRAARAVQSHAPVDRVDDDGAIEAYARAA
jgi:hypothetical protein